jgi:hypothetical protein
MLSCFLLFSFCHQKGEPSLIRFFNRYGSNTQKGVAAAGLVRFFEIEKKAVSKIFDEW